MDNLNPYLQTEVDSVFEMVEQITGISQTMLVTNNRKRHIVDARKILVSIFRRLLKLTCFQAATIINKDHSTVVHYDKMHKVHMGEEEYRRLYSAVSGAYVIRKSIRDEERLQDQFLNLQSRTKLLLDSLEGQGKTLKLQMTNIKDNES